MHVNPNIPGRIYTPKTSKEHSRRDIVSVPQARLLNTCRQRRSAETSFSLLMKSKCSACNAQSGARSAMRVLPILSLLLATAAASEGLRVLLVDLTATSENVLFLTEVAKLLDSAESNHSFGLITSQDRSLDLDHSSDRVQTLLSLPSASSISQAPLKSALTEMHRRCSGLLAHEGLVESIRARNFDVAIVPLFLQDACALNLLHIAQIPVVGALTCSSQLSWLLHQSGQTVSLDRAPRDLFDPSTAPSLWQRILNALEYFNYFKEIDSILVSPTEDLVQRHFETERVPLRRLYGQIQLFLFNTHPLTHGSIRTPANAVQVGSFQDERFSKPYLIPLNLTHPKIEGVAFVTLDPGNLEDFSESELIIAMESVRGLAYIWKHPAEKSWLRPRIKRDRIQHNSDVLGNPKTRLLLSNCDMMEAFDSLFFGAPVVCFPRTESQVRSAAILRDLGVAIVVDKIKDVAAACDTLLKDKRHRLTARHLSEDLRDAPLLASDNILYWLEHVAKHKGVSHVRRPVPSSVITLYNVDVILVLVVSSVTCMAVLASTAFYSFSKIVSGYCNMQTRKIEKKE